MGLVLLKPKPKVIDTAAQALLSEFAEKIDLLGKLTVEAEATIEKIKTLQEKLKPVAAAKAEVQAMIDLLEVGDDVDDNVQLGEVYKVEVGKKGSSRNIKDLAMVKKLMGTDTFMKVATVTLKDIDAYLTPPEKLQVLTTKRTARGFKLIKRV